MRTGRLTLFVPDADSAPFARGRIVEGEWEGSMTRQSRLGAGVRRVVARFRLWVLDRLGPCRGELEQGIHEFPGGPVDRFPAAQGDVGPPSVPERWFGFSCRCSYERCESCPRFQAFEQLIANRCVATTYQWDGVNRLEAWLAACALRAPSPSGPKSVPSVTHLVGEQGSGKSTIALYIVAGMEAQGKSCAHIEADELLFDFKGNVGKAIASRAGAQHVLIEHLDAMPEGFTPRMGDIVIHMSRSSGTRRPYARRPA